MGDTQSRKLEEYIVHELLLIVCMTGLAIVQTTLLPAPLGFPPNLLVILVVCRALMSMEAPSPEVGTDQAIRWAFYGGIALDLCAATPIGSHALALLLAAALVILLGWRLQMGGALLPLLAVLLGTLVYELVLALINHYTVASVDWGSYALVVLVPSALLTLIPALPIFHLFRWQRNR